MAGMGAIELRTAVLAGSVLFHAALLVVLVRYLSHADAVAEPPVLQVTLLPRQTPPDRPPPRALDAPPRQLAAPIAPRAAAPATAVPPAPFQPAPPDAAARDARGQQVLRALAVCDPARLDRLSPQDRERCDARQARRGQDIGDRLNLDTSGRYVGNETPYLVRKPKDGCKVRATGDVAPGGDSGHVRAGVGCAVSF